MLRLFAAACLALCAVLLMWGCTPKPTATPGDESPVVAQDSEADQQEPIEEDAISEDAPDLPDEELQAMLDQAQEHLDDDDWDQALEVYDELAALAPNRTQVWVGRGVVLRGLAQPEDEDLDDRLMEEAIDNFSTALELDSELAEAYYERGQAYAIIGRTYFMEDGALGRRGEEALMAARADFEAALELNPGDAQTYLARADVHEALGDCYSAIKDYEEVLDIIPGNTTATQGIARCEEILDDAE